MGYEIHIRLEKYSRLDGMNWRWSCEFEKNLSLKISEGILFVLHGYKVVEAVFLLHKENVKVALKKRILAVAYVNQGFVTRFRVLFPAELIMNKMKDAIEIIDHYNPIIRMEDDSEGKGGISSKHKPKPIASATKIINTEKQNILKEIPVSGLKKLAEYGKNDLQKEALQVLILDPKFLQYVIMLNRTMQKRKDK